MFRTLLLLGAQVLPSGELRPFKLHNSGEGVGGRACMPLLVGGPGAGKSAQAGGPPRSCGPPNLMLSSVAVTISGSHGVADSLISGKVCAQM